MNRPITFRDPQPPLPFANCSTLAPCVGGSRPANLYSLLRYLVPAIGRKARLWAVLRPDRGRLCKLVDVNCGQSTF